MKQKRNRLTISFDDGISFGLTDVVYEKNHSDGTFSLMVPMELRVNGETKFQKTIGLHFSKDKLFEFFEDELLDETN